MYKSRRNRLAGKGKNKRPGSNLATGRNYEKEEEFQKSKKQKKYRAFLNKVARRRGIYGKRFSMGKDLSHTKKGGVELEKSSKNRARNRGKK